MEKTVKPYDADWNLLLYFSLSAASPTCMAVRTMAIYTVVDASQVKLSWKKLPYWCQCVMYGPSSSGQRANWQILFRRLRRSSPYLNRLSILSYIFLVSSCLTRVIHTLHITCSGSNRFSFAILKSLSCVINAVQEKRKPRAHVRSPLLHFFTLLVSLLVPEVLAVAPWVFVVILWESASSPKQLQGSIEARCKVQKYSSSRKRGIGLRNIRPIVQTKCISICSVRKMSRDRSS